MTNSFYLMLIQPSRYDDEGYVIQWYRSTYPSNPLSTLNALAENCAARQVLGSDVEILIEAYEEQCELPTVETLAARMKQAPAGCLTALVGVQTSQFPRAADLARRFRALDVPVVIGGFHVSGAIAMLPELPPELREMLDLGVSLFAGEAEGRFERVLRDAQAGTLEPIYHYIDNLVDLEQAELPRRLPENVVRRLFAGTGHTYPIEAGRGCPFKCSFCCIINVHGRKPRARSAETVVEAVRSSVAQGNKYFMFTDDNFARNNNWREILEALAALREQEGLAFNLVFQTDTQSDRIPDFIPLAVRAGCTHAFIGLESINSDTLAQVGKKHNVVERYQRFFLAWKRYGVVTIAGYIIGFPNDTPDSVLRDLTLIQQNLAVDILYSSILTHAPGSADHAELWRRGMSFDPDLSHYSGLRATMPHPNMNAQEWERLYHQSWRVYYNDAHTARILRRHVSLGGDPQTLAPFLIAARSCVDIKNIHPLIVGWFRLKKRAERRFGLPLEAALPFYLRYAWTSMTEQLHLIWQQRCVARLIRAALPYRNCPDPNDPALAGLPQPRERIAATEEQTMPG